MHLRLAMCTHPITLYRKNPIGQTYAQEVPCGHCVECVKRKSTSWGIRAFREVQSSSTITRFVTITYDDAHLPKTSQGNPTLSRRDVTLFLKSLRRYMWYHYEIAIRFFCSSEYGSKTNRPHYHFLFHGIPNELTNKEFKSIILKLWKRCLIVDTQYIKDATSSGFYVGKYVGKTPDYAKDDPDVVRSYKRASIGYGAVFSDEEKRYFLAEDVNSNPVDDVANVVKHDIKDDDLFRPSDYSIISNPAIYFQSIYKPYLPNMKDENAKRFITIYKRFFECHRPRKDGSYYNIMFPPYLALKLYGENLYKALKNFNKYSLDMQRIYLIDINFFKTLDRPTQVKFYPSTTISLFDRALSSCSRITEDLRFRLSQRVLLQNDEDVLLRSNDDPHLYRQMCINDIF